MLLVCSCFLSGYLRLLCSSKIDVGLIVDAVRIEKFVQLLELSDYD